MPADTDPEETGCRLWLLWFVRVMKGLVLLALLAAVAAYVIIIDYAVKSDKLSVADKGFSVLGNTGFICLAFFMMIAEFEPEWFIKHCVIMHYWAARGFWNIWMGIQTISTSKQLVSAIRQDDGQDQEGINTGLLENFGIAVGSIMICGGVIYCIFTVMCVKPFSKDPSELERPLSGGAAGAADAILAANLALALGMTPSEAQKRFGNPKKGAQEAQKFATMKAEEVAQMKGRLAEAQRTGTAAVRAGVDRVAADASTTYGAAASSASNLASNAQSSYVAPSNGAGDDDSHRKRGGDDEDELMRQYYANAKFDR